MRVVHLEILGIQLLHLEFGTPPPRAGEPPYTDTMNYPMTVGFQYPVDEELITHPLPVRDQ